MPNTNNARGLVPLRDAASGYESGGVEMFYVAATDTTALFIGDPVVKAGSSDAAGVASVTRAAAAGPITGIVEGFVPNGTTDMVGNRAASTAAYILVNTNPKTMFEIQDTVGSVVAADIGLNASMTIGAANAFSKRSGVSLDAAGVSKGTGAALPLKIMGLSQRPGNDFGPFAKILVKINNHTDGNAVAGL